VTHDLGRGGRFFLACVFFAAASVPVLPFTFEPIYASLAPSGGGAIGTFRVKNDGAARIAVKMSVLTRSSDSEGKEINGEADSLFTIFPTRLVVDPGAVKTVKVQWKGNAKPDRELCFRLIAEQVPVDFDNPTSSGIKIMFRYIASLYVTPQGALYSLKTKAEGGTDAEGRTGFFVEVSNTGTRHVVASESTLELIPTDSSAKTVRFEPSNIGALNGANYLPDSSRRFFLPSADAVPGMTYEARLGFTPEF
jgi:fimbrial chaperone protein